MILDLLQNSIEAGADRIDLLIEEHPPHLTVEIRDDGKGMDEIRRTAALDPFFTEPGKHPGRRVGLGIPFLLQTAEQTGGSWDLSSEPGRGTVIRFDLDLENVDTPPLGDVADLLVDLMCYQGDYELQVERRRLNRDYRITRSELREALGEIAHAGARRMAVDFLREWEAELYR